MYGILPHTYYIRYGRKPHILKGDRKMKIYKSEKTMRIVRILEALQCGDETLKQIANIILEKVEFYDTCLKSWDKQSGKFSPEEIDVGKKCCNAGLNMADAIVNELRILFLKS